MDVILYKEFEGSAKKTGKLRGLFPHLLDLKRIQADRNTFLLEKARKIDQGDDDDDKSDDEESDDEEASTTDMILTRIETRSLMLKLWLRRIHLNHQENEEQNDKLEDLEHAVYQELEVIKQYQALVLEKRYNTYQELEALIPSYEDLLEASAKKTMEEKDKVDFEINDDDIVRFRSDLVRICSVLGLRLDFLDRHAKISEDVRDHWTISDWLAIFLQENHGCLDLSEKVSLNRDLLVSIGFDPMGFAIEKILARAGPRKEHIEPSEWAKIFIEDELEYNPLLFDSERFPFRSDFTNQWFQAFEEDDIGVENLERPRQVNILNLVTNDSEIYRHQFELTNFPQQLKDDTHVVLFHGTDHKSGFDILSRGIYLYLGRQKRDFSNRNGFYLTDSFDDAIGWASSTTAKPCVIVFRVTRECLINAKTLRLQEDSKMWHELVHAFRRGKDLNKMRRKLSAYDAIEGPIALLSRNPTTGELSVEKKAFSYQMCLTSDDFADKFQQSLHSIVFYDSREICGTTSGI